jgi:hypothetical protein
VKHPSKAILQAAAGLAAITLVLTRLSTAAMTGTVLIVIILVTAACWIIKDNDRARRLAMLIRASRNDQR